MMTLKELEAATINTEVVREAHAQVEKRLEDALTTKASHEQKAFALMAAYVTIALALFTAFGVLSAGMPDLASRLLVTGILYVGGAVLCGGALWPKTYGALGSDPRAWLRPGVIDGGSKALSFALAYEVFFYRERIESSASANRTKAWFIRGAAVVGLIAPIVVVWGL